MNSSDINVLKVPLEELLKCDLNFRQGSGRVGREMQQFSSDAQIFVLRMW